jgi:hypothetical protein
MPTIRISARVLPASGIPPPYPIKLDAIGQCRPLLDDEVNKNPHLSGFKDVAGLLEILIDLYLIHDRGICGIRHSGAGRNPDSYQIPTKWNNPRSTALSATRSHLTNWIPACAGMTSFLIFHAVFIYVKLNNSESPL